MLKTFCRNGLLIFLLMTGYLNSVYSEQPVSISYEKLIQCYPELANNSLSFKVDLDRLKEVIDLKFISDYSQNPLRKVQFEDVNGRSLLMRIESSYKGKKKISSELTLQQFNERGSLVEVNVPAAQKINPKQDFIESYLLPGKVKFDEILFVDTKLNGVVLAYRKNFKEVQEIRLTDKVKNRSIFCEKQKDLGIICTCTKK